ncbi:MAG TPA: ATP-binding protein [Polyangiaceae bacterium]|nr:ATP-binding protein [Polyangiaceae bacterium]
MTSSDSSSRPRRLISVGTKLAGATVLMMSIITIGIYTTLSAYERDNLFKSKETAALAVTRLFADSSGAAVVFGDAAAIQESLNTLGRDRGLEFAAVWALTAEGGVGERLGHLPRGTPETVTAAPASLQMRRTADRLVVISPIRDTNAQPIAVALLAYSLSSDNAAVKDVQKRTLWISASIACGLTLLLLAVAQLTITRPLNKLMRAVKRVERGGETDLDVRSNDEIGVLAAAFRSMASAIRNREENIQAKSRDMRLVLDNVGQGFITLNTRAEMSSERSRILDEWFGVPAETMSFIDYLRAIDQRAADWFDLAWEALIEDVLPFEVSVAQLPALLEREGHTFELAYRPIFQDERLHKMVVVITDATERVQRERSERAQHETMSIFQKRFADRTAFDEFFAEATCLVEGIEASDGSNAVELKRQVHTLKGNCALFGIQSVTHFCHVLEDQLTECARPLSAAERQQLRALWREVANVRAKFGDVGQAQHIQLSQAEHLAFLDDLRRRVDHDTLKALCASWKFESAASRLALVAEHIHALGARLGKPNITVTCEPTRLRLPPGTWRAFWSVFAHVVRNVVDHGVESAEARRASGKPEHAQIALSVRHEGAHVVLSLQDDGPGIDESRIAERAEGLGLPHASRDELLQALFVDGVSSRAEVTATSGRGVGLGAVRAVVEGAGGRIEVRSETGRGVRFQFVFPESMLWDEQKSRTVPLAQRLAS